LTEYVESTFGVVFVYNVPLETVSFFKQQRGQ